MDTPRKMMQQEVVTYASKMRFPVLFFVTVGLFLVNVFLPDPIPFVDEILLGLGALLLGAIRQRVRTGVTTVEPATPADAGEAR
jgi:hypothetical protein